MPTYEYECAKCKKTFEVQQKMADEPLTKCATKWCRGKIRRLISGPSNFILKGGHWYKDGY